MPWEQTDRLLLRTFLSSPTGERFKSHLRDNRPQVPKEFREPKAISSSADLQLLGAYSYKTTGWEECVDFIDASSQEVLPQEFDAFGFTDSNYNFDPQAPENQPDNTL